MSSLKRLNPYTSNIFEVNKSWSFFITGSSEETINDRGFEFLEVTKSLSPSINPSFLRYNLLNQLFYHKHVDLLYTSSRMDSLYYESSSQQPNTSSYYSLNENPAFISNFPTGSGDSVSLLSISQNYYGDNIKHGTFVLSSSNYYITDDKLGNLYNENNHVGNIFYSHGLIIFTDSSIISNVRGTYPYNLSYSNVYKIIENNISCVIKDYEFNLSYNPSLLTDPSDLKSTLQDYTTGSFFSPYITSIGLYNDNNELLLIAKLSKPYPLSPNTDTTFIIRWDS